MAKNWDKIKDKMAQGFAGPQPSDWRQMAEQLDAHPHFRKKPPRFGWLGAGILLLFVAVPLLWWLSPRPAATLKSPPQSPNSAGESAAQLSTHPQRAASDDWDGKKTKQQAIYPTVEPDASPTSKSLANSPKAKNQTPAQEQAHKAPFVTQQASAQKNFSPLSTSGLSTGAAAQKAPQLSPKAENTAAAKQSPSTESVLLAVPVLRLSSKNWQAMLPAMEEHFSVEKSAVPPVPPQHSQTSHFIDPAMGFRLSELSLTGEGMALFGPRPNANSANDVKYYAAGGGVEWHWRRKNWALNLGLRYRQQWSNFTNQGGYLLDSTRLTALLPREEIEVNSVWVIDSLYHGRWVNDTMRFTRTDTAKVYLHDSTAQSPRRGAVEHYLELPIYTSYRWKRGSWWFELGGGLVLSHWRSAGSENTHSQMGLHLMLQPQVGFYFHPRWSAVARFHSRYALQQALPQRPPWVGALQLGLHFHF